MLLIPIFVFVFGAIVGSFLNVVIFRLQTGRSIVNGRSRCDRCDRTLTWYELIPVFSFLALRGKCRTCKIGLSFSHPFVELTTAILFTLAYIHFVVGGLFTGMAWLQFIVAVVVISLSLVIALYDLKHKIIPDSVVYPLIIIGFLSLFWNGGFVPTLPTLNAFLAGPFLAAPFFLIWFFSQGKAMGFGDVKLALGIGWFVGISGAFSVFLLSFWIGAIVGLFLIGLSKKHSLRSEVPFGPFLIIAFALVGIFSVNAGALFSLW